MGCPKAELQFGAPWFRIEIIPVWEVTESWPLTTENVCIPSQYGYFESFPFHQKFFLFSSARPRDFDGILGTGLPMSMYTTKTTIDMWRFNIPQLKEFLTFSVNDRYQLNYFICIKDFNCIDNYFFKIKIVFFLYLLPSASWKENDL